MFVKCIFIEPFEYQVVAVIDNRYEVSTLGDLRGSRFCHPGHGYEADWTDTLANVSKICYYHR